MQFWLVTVPDKIYFLNVGWVVVENTLGNKVVVSRRPRIEFEANHTEALTLYQSERRISLESVS